MEKKLEDRKIKIIYHIRNRMNQPITVDPLIPGGRTLHFGPQEVKRNITEEEFNSVQVQAAIARKYLVVVNTVRRSET